MKHFYFNTNDNDMMYIREYTIEINWEKNISQKYYF